MKATCTFFTLCLLLFACKKETCLGDAGAVTSVSRTVTAFHEIEVYDNINVILVQDTIERLEILAARHLEPNISTAVENGILRLKNEASCTWLRNADEKITVYVHVKKLDKLLYAGSGNIYSANTLIADHIMFYSETGAGNINVTVKARLTSSYIMDENADFTFHGTSDICFSYTNSRGSIDFSDFTVKKMVIEYGGVRDATIHVTEDLNAILFFKGNLFYKGAPLVTKNEVHSSGRLIRLF